MLTDDEREWALKRGESAKEAIKITQRDAPRHGVFAIDCYQHIVSLTDSQIEVLEVNKQTVNEGLQAWLAGEVTFVVEDDCEGEIGCNQAC